MPLLLGCIADDLTGATDLALTLVREGLKTVQVIGVPRSDQPLPEAEAIVVALKSRTSPVNEAVEQSLASLKRLEAAGAQQFFFKYCSTFDSTDAGNIGPVIEALMEHLDTDFTIACPAFPANGRTVYMGHLFVDDVLLSNSPLRDHPLTPMTDPDLVRVLQRQTKLPVGLVSYPDVEAGAPAIIGAFDRMNEQGKRIAIVDALNDDHLRAIGRASVELQLVTGGSGVAMGLPMNFFARKSLSGDAEAFDAPAGSAAILAGSCSAATRAQVAAASAAMPSFRIDPAALAAGEPVVDEALTWAGPHLAEGPVLIYSSAPPEQVEATQSQLGRAQAGALVEQALAAIARGLVENGVRRLIVAGGETSGAVVETLGISCLEIGPEIDPGVPWTRALDGQELALALKSGNFGGTRFFLKALDMLA